MTTSHHPAYRPLPTGARVLLHLISLLFVPPAFFLGFYAPDGHFPPLLALVHVALATALTLALYRFAPRLDPRLRLHLSPFLIAGALAYTLALWAFLIGLLF